MLPSQLLAVPGGQIMSRTKDSDVHSLFNEFCRYFRLGNHWLWTGAAVTPAGAAILDGVAVTGQCLALARAFRCLATTRKPYGLAMPESQVLDPFGPGRYEGRYQHGFISRHQGILPGNVLGLASNILQPPLNRDTFQPLTGPPLHSQLSEYYFWGDHKTVPYEGLYYDPSYGRIWESLEQMAAYHLRTADPTFKRRLARNEGGDEICDFYEVEDKAGDISYFRELSLAELAHSPSGGLQGPYAVLPGQAA
ncbi:MAG TPA: hypothetical protein VMA71_03735 [Alloacidobacterium sp.]|nr:hypothetical protein [Alloacidobacterium sp.]